MNDRKFIVKIDDSLSQPRSFSKGVPQGSVLGPFIFSVLTNDLCPVGSSTKMVKYANDINIVGPLRKKTNAKLAILIEIHNIEECVQLIS